jgi:hypothetical protein
MGSDHLFGVT